MKNFLIILSSIFLISCSSSKQYYEPSNTQSLSTTNVKDSNLLAKYKDYEIINEQDNLTFISNPLGFLKILKDSEVIFDKKFDAKIVSINTQGNKAAMVDALNNIIIFDLYNHEYILSQGYGKALGVIKKLPNPIFTDKIIMIPTLDGKLVIMDNFSHEVIRSFNVGSSDFFNNILYLNATSERLLAASSSKVITIDDNKSYIKMLNIKKVAEMNNFIYILSSDGTIYKYDYRLNEIAKIKYKYANFNGAYAYNSFLYAIEYGGYLIKLDENLNEIAVYELSGKISDKAYFKDDILFYDGKSYKLQ